jgi:hypothetical protein
MQFTFFILSQAVTLVTENVYLRMSTPPFCYGKVRAGIVAQSSVLRAQGAGKNPCPFQLDYGCHLLKEQIILTSLTLQALKQDYLFLSDYLPISQAFVFSEGFLVWNF